MMLGIALPPYTLFLHYNLLGLLGTFQGKLLVSKPIKYPVPGGGTTMHSAAKLRAVTNGGPKHKKKSKAEEAETKQNKNVPVYMRWLLFLSSPAIVFAYNFVSVSRLFWILNIRVIFVTELLCSTIHI